MKRRTDMFHKFLNWFENRRKRKCDLREAEEKLREAEEKFAKALRFELLKDICAGTTGGERHTDKLNIGYKIVAKEVASEWFFQRHSKNILNNNLPEEIIIIEYEQVKKDFPFGNTLCAF